MSEYKYWDYENRDQYHDGSFIIKALNPDDPSRVVAALLKFDGCVHVHFDSQVAGCMHTDDFALTLLKLEELRQIAESHWDDPSYDLRKHGVKANE